MSEINRNSHSVDRGEAVNLARNILGSDAQLITDKGIATLAQAVLDMDKALRAQQAGPAERPDIKPAIWDGTVRIDSDCIINGIEVKAGTILKAGDVLPSAPQSAGADDERLLIATNAYNAAVHDALECYSPDDTATDWADKIRALQRSHATDSEG